MKRRIRDIRDKIKYRRQRGKKGYCDYDLYSMHDWFIRVFPKMLGEFAECTCGYPMDEDELKAEVDKMPCDWIVEQKPVINSINRSNERDDTFDIKDGMVCWLLIILRMKYCFERCDEWHSDYDKYNESKDKEDWFKQSNMIEDYKKEGFYLMEKYFFNLWW